MSPLVRITTWVGLLLAALALTTSLIAQMTVVRPDGNVRSTGEPTVPGVVTSVSVRPQGPTSSCPAHYRVRSADGPVVSGSWSFRRTTPGTGTPGPTAAATDAGSDIPDWVFGVVTVALVAAGALWAVRRRP
ncbi:hypothetical protein [Mycobacterium haemophilum]|uniref:hypothetical protein n=1 Tax=Mycobacterium haemophilum TaxID=29311 RepID=UPI00069C2FED|nr:hypothetical protein [Mycobacterium haemophilum]ALL56340.1 hypothetical protein B586_02865 [Mycobacterium haemophilum DSM 44634]